MGGIPTDIDGRVVIDEKNTPLPGLYAAGEVACVSVHGANRLGTNSLVDILVFGRRGGRHALKFIQENDWAPLPAKPDEPARAMVSQVLNSTGKERAADIRDVLQDEMMDKASVFRDAPGLTAMREKLRESARALPPGEVGGSRYALQHRVAGGDRTRLFARSRRCPGGKRAGTPGEPRGPLP